MCHYGFVEFKKNFDSHPTKSNLHFLSYFFSSLCIIKINVSFLHWTFFNCICVYFVKKVFLMDGCGLNGKQHRVCSNSLYIQCLPCGSVTMGDIFPDLDIDRMLIRISLQLILITQL